MSRSYKKNVIAKDKSKFHQKLSHSKFRKKTKQKLHEGRYDELPVDLNELENQYNITDYIYVASKEDEEYKYAKRK